MLRYGGRLKSVHSLSGIIAFSTPTLLDLQSFSLIQLIQINRVDGNQMHFFNQNSQAFHLCKTKKRNLSFNHELNGIHATSTHFYFKFVLQIFQKIADINTPR